MQGWWPQSPGFITSCAVERVDIERLLAERGVDAQTAGMGLGGVNENGLMGSCIWMLNQHW